VNSDVAYHGMWFNNYWGKRKWCLFYFSIVTFMYAIEV